MKRKSIKYYIIGRMFEDIDLYDKPFWVFLDHSFQGIGKTLAKRISIIVGLSCEHSIKSLDITVKQMLVIIKVTEIYLKYFKCLLGRNLVRAEQMSMEFEIKRGSYRGFRYIQHLPVRHQRTHTNANSVKRILTTKSKNFRLSLKKII